MSFLRRVAGRSLRDRTPGCVDRQHHILHHHYQHQCSPGCVPSPLLYSLFTHDCVAIHSSNTIIKFADDTTIIGLITSDNETAYREEVRALTSWCRTKPPSQRQKNKGADNGLQEEAERATRPPLHQQDYSGESQQLQVPQGFTSART
ncbi:hypothetical protein L3Q82_001045 [Scortum barcoo]|uniref:Uncharacterized protein n=1 Tax=Scortum barcoo TaxID=214431 RepID=A0ACB8WAK4_9TELE|nr:hypothetical protein L3Q82_001045 [Scortum barcoo]